MALLAQGFDPSGYTPSYAVANAANEQLFQRQMQTQEDINKSIIGIGDQQKKNKEMEARIKGSLSLLDNAKTIYPEFSTQIDQMKMGINDPNASLLNRTAISEQAANNIAMLAQHGTEGIKTALKSRELDIEAAKVMRSGGGAAPKYEMKPALIPTAEGNIEYQLPYDERSGRYYDPNTLTPIKDLNKWYKQESGWEAGEPTSSINSSSIKATAFGQPEYDPTTKQEIASGRMAQVGGNPSQGSSGMAYRGLESQLPTVASKDYAPGSILNVKSNLFPEGKQFQVAGTGPKSGVLDFYASNKPDYEKLSNQQIQGIEVVNPNQPTTTEGAISSAASMSTQGTPEEQYRVAQLISENAGRATASTGVPAVPATGEAQPIYPEAPKPVRLGGVLKISPEQQAVNTAKAEITAHMESLSGYGKEVPQSMSSGIIKAMASNNPAALTAYSKELARQVDEVGKTKTALAPTLEKERIAQEKAMKSQAEMKMQGELDKNKTFRYIQEANDILNKSASRGGISNAIMRGVAGYNPQSDQSRLNDIIGGLQATAKFDTMQKMRMASPTGATGLGQLSNAEGQSLERKATTLRASGKPDDIRKDLISFKTDLLDTVHGSRQQRIKMLEEGKITPKQFNQAESEYPAPDLLKNADGSVINPEQENRLKQYGQ